ncbi:RNA-guided endonuclease IscB [Desulfosporosinus sp. BICA1-9]|uniref:RNA-guided endonuclease IscB n=1 Tax=Desulfosporosinus sp. BICA1-9 TaxID=1531958 RepID=UPI00054B9936|nr:RNA-guided endonuclease IscB [Desulfosporosinus sp. BICA1-9]KJS46343.1 MAG: HNH endonuclease [Peptococcaceae bacterium BRH_c23]KJS85767.1 MAG: HNH endonuclease [Desulfosporosinus sp. BICA1-9]HBW34293.1 HNH endonuclease [Desulfosporosinus sp.]
MLVYVLNQKSEPLMPCSPSKARKLLKQDKAKVIKTEPFTIQLLHGSSGYKQEIILGVDAGSKVVGLTATTTKKELFSAEVQLRNDIVDLLSTRRQNRRTRRNRLRYRKPRFSNRVKSKNKGWLAPSIENKILTHLTIVSKVYKILPVSNIIVEVASFDIQKIKNPSISGVAYQQGEQMDFWNVREYVLFRDGHHCHGKKGCKNKILNVHHIESRKIGGDSPSNLITLCEECHDDFHKGKLKLNLKRGQTFKDATFMGIMRWSFYNKLKKLYPAVSMTYGYITKNTRITHSLPKEHRIDALCISGNPLVERLDHFYFLKKVRCHNRQIHKVNLLKGGVKKLNRAQYEVKGFRLFDKVQYQGRLYYIFGRRNSGFFDIRTLDGTKVNKGSVSCKSLKLIEKRKTILTERRMAG